MEDWWEFPDPHYFIEWWTGGQFLCPLVDRKGNRFGCQIATLAMQLSCSGNASSSFAFVFLSITPPIQDMEDWLTGSLWIRTRALQSHHHSVTHRIGGVGNELNSKEIATPLNYNKCIPVITITSKTGLDTYQMVYSMHKMNLNSHPIHLHLNQVRDLCSTYSLPLFFLDNYYWASQELHNYRTNQVLGDVLLQCPLPRATPIHLATYNKA